jgi:hypothetical protein
MIKKNMDVYLSYWSFNEFDIDNLSDKMKMTLACTRLSYYFASLHYENVYMVTDSKSKCLFEDIPFNDIYVELDDLNNMDERYNRYWSISKIKTVEFASKKGRPFMHIDYDVFLPKPLPDFLFEGDVFCQNPEPIGVFKNYNVDVMYKKYKYLGYASTRVENAYNTGLLGFTNVDFANKFATSALEFTFHKDNTWALDVYHEKNNYNGKFAEIDESTEKVSGLQCVLWNEQYYIGCAIESEGVKVICHFDGYDQFENDKVKKENGWGYSHLMSGKEDPAVIKQITELSSFVVSNDYKPGLFV